MALVHKLPVELGDVRPKRDLEVPPFLRPAKVVEFRRGADVVALAKEILTEVSVKVDAAVGAGKTTRLPSALALQGKKLVFHVAANPLLVYDTYNYVVKMANSSSDKYPPLEMHQSLESVIPRSGVYFIGAADFVALMIRKKGLSGFSQCVVVLDEAHESDAFTHVVRNLVLPSGAGHLVCLSATFGVGGYRMRESVGSVRELKYPAEEVPEDWDVHDVSKPWAIGAIADNLLVFADSRTQSKIICDKYSASGLRVYRLEAGMAKEKFHDAMSAMRNRKGEVVVLVADSSFRSGFTFDVGLIIDTGRVSYFDPRPGVLARKSRQIFGFEVEQTMGRGGRLPGLRTRYYRPDFEVEDLMCDLQGVEMEAASYLYRVLGFSPVRELAATVMRRYNLPKTVTLVAACNGQYPLTYYVMGSDGKVRDGIEVVVVADRGSGEVDSVEAPPSAEERSSVAGSVVDEGRFAKRLDRALSAESDSVADTASVRSSATVSDDWAGVLGIVWGLDNHEVQECDYVYVSDIPMDGVGPTFIFPKGFVSVLNRMADDINRTGWFLWSTRDKDDALRLCCDEYNVLNAKLRGAQRGFMEFAGKHKSRVRGKAKRWFVKAIDEFTKDAQVRSILFQALLKLSKNYTSLVKMDKPVRAEDQYYKRTIAALESLSGAEKASASRYGDKLNSLTSSDSLGRTYPDSVVGEAYSPAGGFSGRTRRKPDKLEWDMPSWTGVRKLECEIEAVSSAVSSVKLVPSDLVSGLTGWESKAFSSAKVVTKYLDGTSKVSKR